MSKILCPPLFSLEKAVIRSIKIVVGTPQKPPTEKRWLITDGCFRHITGTDTVLMIRIPPTLEVLSTTRVVAANPDATLPLFPTLSLVSASLNTTWILDDTMQLDLFGDATAYARIQVLEF